MWPYTESENAFYSEVKKNTEAFLEKAKSVAFEVIELQTRTVSEMFSLANKYTGNAFQSMQLQFDKQANDYLRTLATYGKSQ